MESEIKKEAWIERDKHIIFLEMMYELLPTDYESQEINHLTLAYFSLSSLDLLGALDRVDKDAISTWVLSLQTHQKNQAETSQGPTLHTMSHLTRVELSASLSNIHWISVTVKTICLLMISHFTRDICFLQNLSCNGSHLASTYCALCILKIIGYDFSLLDSEHIVSSMRNLQLPDGSFMPIHIGAEADLRFLYCAAAISYMLDDWNGMDKEKAKEYILTCQSYDGGFGLCPGLESHGGATFCAMASLLLMGFIEYDLLNCGASTSIINVPLLLDWAMRRHAADGGFQGRTNKPSDTCYAFWIGGVLKILGGSKFVDKNVLTESLLTCQSQYGGFSKFAGQLPELYHSYYGFSAFSLLDEPCLSSLCVELGITKRAASSS